MLLVDGTQLNLAGPYALARAEDGTLFLGTGTHIARIAPDGLAYNVLGSHDETCEPYFGDVCGEGVPASEASVLDYGPHGMAVGPDGSLYFTEGSRVRVIDPDGIVRTFAGSADDDAPGGFGGDGGPATMAELDTALGIDVGPDGSVYVVDAGNYRIRRIDPDGIIDTVAGTGEQGPGGDGCAATLAPLGPVGGIAIGPDGSLYIGEVGQIRRIDRDGIIRRIAGRGREFEPPSGDGGPASEANVDYPTGIDVGADGSVLFADGLRVRRIAPDGTVSTVAGNGDYGDDGNLSPDRMGDSGLAYCRDNPDDEWCNPLVATAVPLGSVADVEVAPDGSL
jgi:serine/threonine-protein kinase